LNLYEELTDPAEEAAFYKALLGEDDLGAVIRAHLYVEAKLIQWLEEAVENVEALNAMKLDYGRRVNMALALGLDLELGRPLKALGKIRNDLAHKLNFSLTQSNVGEFFNSCGNRERAIIRASYAITREDTNSTLPDDIKQLLPKEQFALVAVILRSAIIVCHHGLKEGLKHLRAPQAGTPA
jgi:hypothetical protein